MFEAHVLWRVPRKHALHRLDGGAQYFAYLAQVECFRHVVEQEQTKARAKGLTLFSHMSRQNEACCRRAYAALASKKAYALRLLFVSCGRIRSAGEPANFS